MAVNPILDRVVQFIRVYPPLDLLDEQALFLLGDRIKIAYHDHGDTLFRKGDQPEEYFYLVRKGSVEIKDPESGVLIDVCEPGDIFGIRALLGGDNYLATSTVLEPTLIYRIPVKTFRSIMDHAPQVKDYFLAGLASGVTTKGTPFRALAQSQKVVDYTDIQPLAVESRKAVFTSLPDETIANGAKTMRSRRIGSLVIVDYRQHIVGIVTDQDLRNNVSTGEVATHQPLSEIMSSPVKCVKPDLTYLEYLMIMMDSGVRHLCVTESGFPDSTLIGILTERDLLNNQSFSPIVFVRRILACHSLEELRNLWWHRSKIVEKLVLEATPLQSLSNICTHFTDILIRKIVELENITSDFAWVAVGSYGRGEQIILTDLDHYWIYSDDADHSRQFETAQRLTDLMATFGFAREPAGIEPANENWCQSVSKWKQTFSQWIQEPTETAVLHCSIFFDSRCIAGDSSLLVQLQSTIKANLSKNQLLTHFLAKDVLRTPPPLSFFKNFIVEKDGLHKDKFDIKLRVLLPIIDSARVLALTHSINEASTIQRFLSASTIDSSKRELYHSVVEAFIFAITMKVKEGLKQKSDGRYIAIHELSKLDKMQLRNIFQVIEDLQNHISFKFQSHKI